MCVCLKWLVSDLPSDGAQFLSTNHNSGKARENTPAGLTSRPRLKTFNAKCCAKLWDISPRKWVIIVKTFFLFYGPVLLCTFERIITPCIANIMPSPMLSSVAVFMHTKRSVTKTPLVRWQAFCSLTYKVHLGDFPGQGKKNLCSQAEVSVERQLKRPAIVVSNLIVLKLDCRTTVDWIEFSRAR